jgi:hypothetical protein
MALDVSGDGQWCEIQQLVDSVLLAPRKKAPRSVKIGGAGVRVANARREELSGALVGAGAGRKEEGREVCVDFKDGWQVRSGNQLCWNGRSPSFVV